MSPGLDGFEIASTHDGEQDGIDVTIRIARSASPPRRHLQYQHQPAMIAHITTSPSQQLHVSSTDAAAENQQRVGNAAEGVKALSERVARDLAAWTLELSKLQQQ